jgi:hypothetical protein
MESLLGVYKVHVDPITCMWTPPGVLKESMDYIRRLPGVSEDFIKTIHFLQDCHAVSSLSPAEV